MRKQEKQPKPNLKDSYQNLKARAMNAERMVQKLTDEREILKASSVIKNYLIAGLLVGLIITLFL